MYTAPVRTPKNPELYTPWFDLEAQEVPVRSGVYQVANSAVCRISDNSSKYQGEPYGWTYQYWDAEKKTWHQYGGWGFYDKHSARKWRGQLKSS